ncbi:MAG TPA: hypothetical protein VD833_19195 [Vicinamibacterales bacterium]|nr:hypothetical protein [Vicinamibacterales bacterium]
MRDEPLRERFQAALDVLVEQIKADRCVLAAILCGSLSHDTVWARSDIDLLLVTVDDAKGGPADATMNADGVTVHAILVPRAQFRKTVEGATHNSFVHALLAKGRLLYTHDPSIAELCRTLHEIGHRDTELQLLRSATYALPAIDKARKWLVTRGDLDYAALWILYAATPLARIEVIGRRLFADREVIPQALSLNPSFFGTIYTDLLNTPKQRDRIEAALDAVDAYMAGRAPALFRAVMDYLRDAGEPRSCTEMEQHFTRNFDVAGVTTACEYLASRNLIGKASTPLRLTRRSSVEVQELAFFHLGGDDERWRPGGV